MRREGKTAAGERTRSVVAGPVVLVILACSLWGCGTGVLSPQALRSQARHVCSTAIRRSDSVAEPSSNTGGAAFLARGITIFRPELAALKRLAPPHALAGAYRAALADSTQQLDALIATDHNLRSGEDPVIAIKQLDVELTAINVRDHAAWRAFGVPVCSNLE